MLDVNQLAETVRERLAASDHIDQETERAVQAKRQHRQREIVAHVVGEVRGPTSLVDAILRHLGWR